MSFDHRGNNIRLARAKAKEEEAKKPRRLADCPITINTAETRMTLEAFIKVCFDNQDKRRNGFFVYDGAAGDVCRFCEAGESVWASVESGIDLPFTPAGIPEKIKILDLQSLIKERNDGLLRKKITRNHSRAVH